MDARDEIARLRLRGYSWHKIADSLNARQIPTPSGRGVWWPSSAQHHADPSGWRAYIAAYRRR